MAEVEPKATRARTSGASQVVENVIVLTDHILANVIEPVLDEGDIDDWSRGILSRSARALNQMTAKLANPDPLEV